MINIEIKYIINKSEIIVKRTFETSGITLSEAMINALTLTVNNQKEKNKNESQEE